MSEDANKIPIKVLSSLFRISRVATSAPSYRESYQTIMEEIQRHFSPSSASISLISPNNGLLEKEYALGYPYNIKDLSLHVGKGITGQVAFYGESVIVPDVSKDSRYVKLVENVASVMAVPMYSEGQIIGVIDVESNKTDAFSSDDLETLKYITEEATRVLQTVWHQRQLVTQSEQLDALLDIGQKIVSKLELQNLWDAIAEAALDLTGSQLCTLQIFDRNNNLVKLQAVSPHLPEYMDTAKEVSLEESLSGSSIRTRKQSEATNILTPDYLDLKDIPRGSDIASCLSTPMLFEGKVIGIINIYTRNHHRFPNNERRLLQAFASLSAVAYANANLYSRVVNSEEQLRKNERLTTLGLLSAEIAHEIRNPLTVIKLLFGSLCLEYPESDPRTKDVQIIRDKINNLEEIVSKVLSFGKAPKGLFSNWNVEDLLQDTALLVRHKMSQQRINLQILECEDPIIIGVNKGQLQQVFLNLIINAAEAMPNGGKLSIQAKQETIDDIARCTIYFMDTGSGIPLEIQDSIFESFLTGKPEGTGLGLSIVKRILRSHHGDISVHHSSPQGTTMRVELPIHN
ncbi:GAF domain-containing protein [Puniceicoccaceae bacterium K14]|nr:GAF domain-containing protein [Puniceicoccaceae bacterium K14]